MPIFDPHLSQGEIRAHQDQSLPAEKRAKIEAHLAGCKRCQTRAAELEERARQVRANLRTLDQLSSTPAQEEPREARLRLDKRLIDSKEVRPMKTHILARIPRFAWISLIMIAILGSSLAFEPVRALAGDFLALFRVEQVRIVPINEEVVSERLANSSQLEYMLSNEVEVEEKGESQKVSSTDEAQALAGFSLRLPEEMEGGQLFMVQPGARLSFTVDLELMQGVLKDIGREDIQLPENLDGANIQVDIPTSVVASFGDCNYEGAQGDPQEPGEPQAAERSFENCVTLMQVPSPEISAPPDLDLNKIGEAYLQVLGMDPQEAASFASTVNWTTTFVVPVPRYSVEYEEVQVGGTPATLVYDKYGYDRQHYALIWIQDGRVFALSGFGEKDDALRIANSIQ